jgi:hypothetical protein
MRLSFPIRLAWLHLLAKMGAVLYIHCCFCQWKAPQRLMRRLAWDMPPSLAPGSLLVIDVVHLITSRKRTVMATHMYHQAYRTKGRSCIFSTEYRYIMVQTPVEKVMTTFPHTSISYMLHASFYLRLAVSKARRTVSLLPSPHLSTTVCTPPRGPVHNEHPRSPIPLWLKP